MTDALLGMILIVLLYKLFPAPPGWYRQLVAWETIQYALLTWLALGVLGLGAVCALGGCRIAAGVCLLVLVCAWWLRDWLDAPS